jgi:hypothetical protein
MSNKDLNSWGLLIVYSEFEELYNKQILAHKKGDFLVFQLSAEPSIQEYPDYDPVGVLYVAPNTYLDGRAKVENVSLEDASPETIRNFVLDYWLYL